MGKCGSLIQTCGRSRRTPPFTCAMSKRSGSESRQAAVDYAKRALRTTIEFTNRGGIASSSQRGQVEDAQISLEILSGGQVNIPVFLPGKWRVMYTTAPDVVALLGPTPPGSLPFLRAGDIYQEFTQDGKVKNIIQASIPFLLEKGNGITAVVKARYEVRSGRRIALTFEEAGVGDIQISKELEQLLAPALLPRTWLMHRILLAIKEFEVTVPLRRGLPTSMQDRADRISRNVGSEYLLTYLDEDMLIGRQTGSGGSLIFEKES